MTPRKQSTCWLKPAGQTATATARSTKTAKSSPCTMYVYNDAESQSYGEVLQDQLGAAGIGIELLLLEYGSMVDGFNANENDHAAQLRLA